MDFSEYMDDMLEEIESLMAKPETLAIPDPNILMFYKNLSDRRIWIDFTVDDRVMEYGRWIIHWNREDIGKDPAERKPIWVYLFNYGGSADLMWMLLDIIAASETPVYTVNMGKCCSAASLVFMTGHKRFMLPYASVLIHEGSSEITGDAVKVLDQAESYKTMVKKMKTYILEHTNIPAAMLNKKKNNDWELDSETCLKYGVCDVVAEKLSDILCYAKETQ